jgi:hypothetical protein
MHASFAVSAKQKNNPKTPISEQNQENARKCLPIQIPTQDTPSRQLSALDPLKTCPSIMQRIMRPSCLKDTKVRFKEDVPAFTAIFVNRPPMKQ